MTYHKTKDILHVKDRLGNRNVNSTLVYTQLVSFDIEDYPSKVATTTKKLVNWWRLASNMSAEHLRNTCCSESVNSQKL